MGTNAHPKDSVSLLCFPLELSLLQDDKDRSPAGAVEEPEVEVYSGGCDRHRRPHPPGSTSLLRHPWIWGPGGSIEGQHWRELRG